MLTQNDPQKGRVAFADSVPFGSSGGESVSIVVPVYQGERTLEALIAEIESWAAREATPAGRRVRLAEIVLVHDGAIDDSARVIESLAATRTYVRPVWLSRNFGQHPALLAGMAATTGDWVVTMDEDGQHDPADVGAMIDKAIDAGVSLVYAKPTNAPPHGVLRNACSRLAKWVASVVLGSRLRWFHSFRVIDGEIARALARTCTVHVFLDVALSWVAGRSETCPVAMRPERGRPSGYTFLGLLGHFWKLVLASGVRPLRAVAALGAMSILIAVLLGGYALWNNLVRGVPMGGWIALMVALCFFSGAVLVAMAIMAEYLGVALAAAMGRPLYVVLPRPTREARRASARLR